MTKTAIVATAQQFPGEGRHQVRFTASDRANIASLQTYFKAHKLPLPITQALRMGLAIAAKDPAAAMKVIPKVRRGRPETPLSAALKRARAEYAPSGLSGCH